MSSGFASLFWFFAVIAAIPLVLWLLKRTPLGAGAVRGAGPMRTVSTLPLSPSQRVVTVEVGRGDHRTWLVLGVTPSGISTLHTMLPQDEPPADGGAVAVPPPPPQAAFAQLLSRLRQKDF